jgi:hypothetical protein
MEQQQHHESYASWLPAVTYWAFQSITGLTSLLFVLAPDNAHRVLLAGGAVDTADPLYSPATATATATGDRAQRIYRELGFGHTALGFVHNLLFGWNSALLAVVVYGFAIAPKHAKKEPQFFLLSGILSGFTAIAHWKTWRHHNREKEVAKVLGKQKDAPRSGVVLCSVLAAASFTSYYLLKYKRI